MYFPYLRGRQYELIALRELLEGDVLNKKIIPIIEPVRLSSTLIKTIKKYEKEKRKLALIVNPEVGSFFDEYGKPQNDRLVEKFDDIKNNNTKLMFAKILNKNVKEDFLQDDDELKIIICNNKEYVDKYNKLFGDCDIDYNIMPDDGSFRRRIRKNRVMLNDNFNKLDRNTDYSEIEDELFSEDHLFYEDDGYKGFSDYSIVGDNYSDTGFAPRAVVIHIVYFDKDDKLRIMHFVSDSNEDVKDPAGKFSEALYKLIQWDKKMKLNTLAMQEFRRLYKKEAYPGLGTVKKLSIMHHLELISQYFDKVE